MSTAREDLERVLLERAGESAADGLADVVEEHVEFGGTSEDYFASVLRLPSPLLELYCALIFNSTVGLDGLAFAIPRYDHPEFIIALRKGLSLLGEDCLLSIIDRASDQLDSASSTALQSKTPNVTLDLETGGISSEYFAQRKELMPKIGSFLKANRDRVLEAARQLDVSRY